MKKGFMFILTILMVGKVFGQILDNTKTMSLADLYEAVENSGSNDAVMQNYWNYFANVSSLPTDRFEYEDLLVGRSRYDKIDWADDYARRALVGAIGVDRNGSSMSQQNATEYLIRAQDYLIYNSQPGHNDHYLVLAEVFNYLDDPTVNAFHRCLILGTLLYNVTTIADILYEYVADFSDLEDIIDQLASYADNILTQSRNLGNDYINDDSIWPKSNGRIRLAGALGYAGIVLENDTYVEHAIDDLFEWHHPAESFTHQGYLGAYINKSGVYSEGVTYWNFCMKLLTPFFNAYKRVGFNIYGYTDLFTHPYIKDTMENTLQLINPDLSFIINDDSWISKDYYPNSNVKQPDQFSELVPYYYQSDIVQNDIRWLYEKFNDASVNTWWYLGMDSNINVLFSFDNSRNIADTATLPQSITKGSYSSSEYTILRKSSTCFSEFSQAANLIVTHENSLGKDHEDPDQSGFYMFYKGVPLIIDPGYNTNSGHWDFGHEWLASPYAHNVIMANPKLSEETDELNEYWANNFNNTNHLAAWYYDEPIGRDGLHLNQTQINNPCNKDFLISNGNVTHLKVSVTYDHPQPYYAGNYNDIIEIYRNFYQIGEEQFIIFDNVHSSLSNNPNTLMNQLHLAATMYNVPDGNMLDNLIPRTYPGNYTYEYIDDQGVSDIYLHFAMGSGSSPELITDRDKLPQGIFNESDDSATYLPRWGHRDVRIFTETEGDEKFLTLLIPSEESDSPIEETSQSSAHYAAKFSIDQVNYVYTAVNSGSDVYMDGGNTRFVTDASFFMVEANDNFTDFNKFIINSGDHLEIRDETGSEFSDVILFDSDTGGYEEVSVSYDENNICHVSLIPEEGSSPRCKIWRNEGCMTLDDEYLSTHDFIAYDNNYFYLDYDQADLPAEITIVGLYHENLNVTSTTAINNSIFDDNLTITVQEDVILAFAGHNRFGENTEIIVDGTLFLQGATFTSNVESWQGIKCNSGGQVQTTIGSIIENAEIGIRCDGGDVQINESTITKCNIGISIENALESNITNLNLNKITIEVPDDEDAIGIYDHSNLESNILITGGSELDNSVIKGLDEGNGTGIIIQKLNNDLYRSLVIENTRFEYLNEGLHYESSIKTDDEISNSMFVNCETGIYLNGNGTLKHVSNCDFYIDTGDTGIGQNTISCKINICTFANIDGACVGIELNNTLPDGDSTPQYMPSTIDGCTFGDKVLGVECINANPKITNCIFSENFKWSIGVYNMSCINMSWNSKNSFESKVGRLLNVFFFDSGLVNILNGHNDFWDTLMPELKFHDSYDYLSNTINCNGNYWEGRDINNPNQPYSGYISISSNNMPIEFIIADHNRMDDYPNVFTIGDPENRYEEAGFLESEGYSESALVLYNNILLDLLEEEKTYWKNCVDRVFILSLQLEESLNDLITFYDNLITDIPEFVPVVEKDNLINFIMNYQKKVQVVMKNYQEAADIVVERIDNPISQIDSLFAVMELENIYYLASLENGRANVSTTYHQHNPENNKQLQNWHEVHWQQVNELLGIENENENITIPVKPKLFNNYPNPFNPETKISFSIPSDSKVGITIYNIKGQKVKTLINENLEKGIHDVIWRSKDNSGKSVASGVYFYKFDVNGKSKGLKKMLLLK